MKVKVSNPAHRGKAVRAEGGLVSVVPGATVTVDADWTDAQVAAYEAAGLVLKKAGEKPVSNKEAAA